MWERDPAGERAANVALVVVAVAAGAMLMLLGWVVIEAVLWVVGHLHWA